LKGSLRGNERKAEKHVLRALMTFGVMRAQNLLKKTNRKNNSQKPKAKESAFKQKKTQKLQVKQIDP
jgi:hypothetical protein